MSNRWTPSIPRSIWFLRHQILNFNFKLKFGLKGVFTVRIDHPRFSATPNFQHCSLYTTAIHF